MASSDMKHYYKSAAVLFDGGWRANDKEWLKEEYKLSEEEAQGICEYLQHFENQAQNSIEEAN